VLCVGWRGGTRRRLGWLVLGTTENLASGVRNVYLAGMITAESRKMRVVGYVRKLVYYRRFVEAAR
jgi:hypothetical protein